MSGVFCDDDIRRFEDNASAEFLLALEFLHKQNCKGGRPWELCAEANVLYPICASSCTHFRALQG